MSGIARHHAEWLSLVETSGPFLMLPALVRALPQGLPKADASKVARLRAAYEEWAEAQDEPQKEADSLHATWIRLILGELLEFDDQSLRAGDRRLPGLEVSLAEHHETIRPDIVIVEPPGRAKAGTPRLLVSTWPFGQELDSAVSDARWAASPLERMTHVCRSTGIRLGLVTNGERWTLVDAPVGQTAGYASWYSSLWLQEPLTLAAFEALLGVRRFFAAAETDTLEAMLDESVDYQQEVTDQLGLQVRRAVEVLVQALDRADLDRQRELLRDVTPDRLYEASLTVMMRLVFLFCAEERRLLLLGDETYDTNYAVSTLRAQLREEADRVGVEVLERRQDAWARLLATFRAVYGGIEHEALRMPALGSSLFDPDRFPFLEGRATATSWLDTPASPLPIDNRTVLHLLEALQLLRMRGDGGTSEARKLSYRALDIEQIGHVYEGLLDHVAVRVVTDTLGLVGTKEKEPELSLDDLDRERHRGRDEFVDFLKEHTGRSVSALRNDLDAELDEGTEQRLLVACGNDRTLLRRISPYHPLIRKDVWDYPQIYRADSFMVTGGPERRQTGTHYTPKSLTEQIVTETLEPLVYVGPAEGKLRDTWELGSPAELFDLKICDMAMGSGAFLVQVCRWLAERIAEAWEEAERRGAAISADGEVLEKAAGQDLLPADREERLSLARRLVAERCIYGVDINPMAVELAKLSLWLVTLAKGRPFGFLDHNLRSGDSLLGITSLEQLDNFHIDPVRGKALHHTLFDPRHEIQAAVAKALELRQRLRAIRILDIEDVRAMARLDDEAKVALRRPELTADLLVGAAIATAGGRNEALDEKLVDLTDGLKRAVARGADTKGLEKQARELLDTDCPERLRPRRPFHWAIEFPEVVERGQHGFDAIIGNPPFLGGKRISTVLGTTYNSLLAIIHPPASKNTDLVAHFFRRAFALLRQDGTFGLLAVNTIAEGDTRQGGLEWMTKNGATIYAAYPNEPWPGAAAVVTSRVHVCKGDWTGARRLLGQSVPFISAFLSGQEEWSPRQLIANEGIAFQGSIVLGMGFVISDEEAQRMISADRRNEEVLFPYLNGDDLSSDPNQRPSRWVINFWDWAEDRAKTYRLPYNWIRERVYPERLEKSREKSYRNIMSMWWQHWNVRPALYHAIGRGHHFERHPQGWRKDSRAMQQILAFATAASKFGSFAFVPGNMIYANTVGVVADESFQRYAELSSAMHMHWAFNYGSRLETRLRYTPTDCFETYPFLGQEHPVLGRYGEQLHAQRGQLMRQNEIGLTKLYNRYHTPSERDAQLLNLRALHHQIDTAVAKAYGWDDLDLDHGFHNVSYLPENDRLRFTISEAARLKVLRRLAELNPTRYEAVVREGSHRPVEGGLVDLQSERRRRARSGQATVQEAGISYAQSDLAFEEPPRKAAQIRAVYDSANRAARQIREWLATHRGWHAKDEILTSANVAPDDWPSAIKELMDSGAVARQGERRGTKYMAK